jgi:hypothetical protein
MSWININGQKQIDRPVRVRLADGFTRTNEEVTDELLAETGWTYVVDGVAPIVSSSTVSIEVI